MSKTTKTPPISHFRLMKLKKNEDGGLHIEHAIKNTENGQVSWITHKSDYPFIPAPSFTDRLFGLNESLFTSTGFRDIEKVLNSKENLSAKEQEAAKMIKPIVNRYMQTQLDHIRITGFSLSNNEEGMEACKVIITGVREWATGAAALNSPLITLSGTHHGIEEDLSELIEELIDEAYQFIYEGKRSQLEVFPPEEKPDLFSTEEHGQKEEGEEEKGKEDKLDNAVKKAVAKQKEKGGKKKAPEPAKKKKQTKLSKQTSGKKKKK